jgi:hypothetical protein
MADLALASCSELPPSISDIMLEPPTTTLPAIGKIASHSTEDLLDSLQYLRLIYNPEVRGSRRRQRANSSFDTPWGGQPGSAVPPNGFRASPSHFASSHEQDLDILRSDAFERSYAIKWLTALISHSERWEAEIDTVETRCSPPVQSKEVLVQDAASLLAVCAGTAAAGVITRDFTFVSHHRQGDTTQVQLTDAPLENHHFASVGAQTWGGACVLAEAIVEQPEEFGLPIKDTNGSKLAKQELRVLELGAGTGLVSLTVGKLLQSFAQWTHTRVTIVATDFYPSVLANLEANIRSNFPALNQDSRGDRISVTTHFLDWSLFSDVDVQLPPFDRPFDVIFGADIIYEDQHAIWIKSCLTKLLQKTASPDDMAPQPLFHLIIPLRPTHASESGTVETVFPGQDELLHPGGPKELAIVSKELIVCDAGIGQTMGRDEVEYSYYKIGWC